MHLEFKELIKRCAPKEAGLNKDKFEKCFLSSVMRLDEFKEYCGYFNFDSTEKSAKHYLIYLKFFQNQSGV